MEAVSAPNAINSQAQLQTDQAHVHHAVTTYQTVINVQINWNVQCVMLPQITSKISQIYANYVIQTTVQCALLFYSAQHATKLMITLEMPQLKYVSNVV